MPGESVEASVREALSQWRDPDTECGLPEQALRACDFTDGLLQVTADPGYPTDAREQEISGMLRETLEKLEGVQKAEVRLEWKIGAARPQGKMRSLSEVKNMIAVASAKGGVGKSTVAVNLALALAAEGAQVGLLDADIYGPSQQMMLGIPADQRPEVRPPKYLAPIEAHGLQTMSIGFLLTEKTPLVWRGPMVSSSIQQLLGQTLWRGLDYLVVDLPPGTGDIQLTLAQKAPLAGAVIVSTPQQVALVDARKGVEMFRKLGVAVLGIVENMGTYRCSNCGAEEAIFDSGGGERMARECDTDLLGSLPLDPAIQRQTDSGAPPVVAEPEGPAAQKFRSIARRLAARLALREQEAENILRLTDLTDAAAAQKRGPA